MMGDGSRWIWYRDVYEDHIVFLEYPIHWYSIHFERIQLVPVYTIDAVPYKAGGQSAVIPSLNLISAQLVFSFGFTWPT